MKKIRLAAVASSLALLFASSASAITLEESYKLALNNDITFQSAKATLEGSIANANTNYANVLPTVGFTYNWALSRNLSADRNLQGYLSTVSLSLSQNIFSMSAFYSLDVAAKTKRQAEITYVTAKQDLINRVITRYIAVLTANASMNIAKNQVGYYEQVYKNTSSRYNSGLVSAADLDTASSNLNSAKATYIQSKAALETALSNFSLVVGQDVDLSEFFTLGDVIPKLNYSSNVNDITNNLSLKSLAMTKELARLNHKVAVAAYLPTLSLSASLGNSSTNTTQYGERNWGAAHRLDRLQVGVTLTVPIFQGGQIYNNSKYTQALYKQSSYSYDQTYLETKNSFSTNLKSIRYDEEIISTYQDSLASARKAYNSTQAAYRVGTASITTLINAVNQLYSVEQSLINAKFDYVTAVVQQKVLAGTLTEDDIAEISKLLTVKQEIKIED
ncbi:hypothetical protein CJP74_04335 [Psittacicella melopsittaci]|uniref:Uncharacterized protein n=1 Tax=Psittacicella melopsittaci TaxID=2028576 RepID=A0A3A1Y4L9_9GAMM|nr:TolC family protein [Psittacicella melopsittaci]RIY32515.1 hypothetical protein CJP74_04335 [Psittacicella melopsittaci]